MVVQKMIPIEFLRFVCALMICYSHALLDLPRFFPSERIAFWKLTGVNNAALAVEFFFITAGFFLFFSHTKTIKDFFIKRCIRLLPAFYLTLCFCIIYALCVFLNLTPPITHFPSFNNILSNVLLMPMLGSDIFYNVTWFVGCLFWISLFYFSLSQLVCEKTFFFLVCLLTFLSASIAFHTDLDMHQLDIGFLEHGYIRALMGIGLGIILYRLCKDIHISNSRVVSVIFSLMEIFFFWWVMLGLIFTQERNSLNFTLGFAVLFFLFVQQKGVFSSACTHQVWGFLGRISYMIYLTHLLIYQLLFVYSPIPFHALSPISFLIVLCFCACLIGGLLHVVFERPVIAYLSRKFIKSHPK